MAAITKLTAPVVLCIFTSITWRAKDGRKKLHIDKVAQSVTIFLDRPETSGKRSVVVGRNYEFSLALAQNRFPLSAFTQSRFTLLLPTIARKVCCRSFCLRRWSGSKSCQSGFIPAFAPS